MFGQRAGYKSRDASRRHRHTIGVCVSAALLARSSARGLPDGMKKAEEVVLRLFFLMV